MDSKTFIGRSGEFIQRAEEEKSISIPSGNPQEIQLFKPEGKGVDRIPIVRPFSFNNIPHEYQQNAEKYWILRSDVATFGYDYIFNMVSGRVDRNKPALIFGSHLSNPALYTDFVMANGRGDLPRGVIAEVFRKVDQRFKNSPQPLV